MQAKETDLRTHMDGLKSNLGVRSMDAIEKANRECENIEAAIRSIQEYQPKTQQEQYRKEKLLASCSDEFENTLGKFQTAQDQKQVHDLFTEEMLRERNQRMQAIEIKMQLILEMIKDIAELVRDQGAQLDLIENNIGVTHENIQKAVNELEKADSRMRRKRN